MDVLHRLAEILEQRKTEAPDKSYAASLYAKGLDTILKKIGEEATETVIAAKDGEPGKIVYEMADLWFHCCVLLAQQGLGPDDVLRELGRRFGMSGLEEKARANSVEGALRLFPFSHWDENAGSDFGRAKLAGRVSG